MTTIGVFAAIFDSQRRILCVKQNYGPRGWTTPGGRLESGESPIEALVREVHEETGYLVQAKRLLGVYSATFKDDIVLSIEAEIVGQTSWEANDEIAELGFFAKNELPRPMNPRTALRIEDAFAGQVGIIRVFSEADGLSYLTDPT
jgi:ADP-ribose pyrophosphatase YjhB (NUDIX family)